MLAENNKKYLIIYHFEDNDGVCSAALIKRHLIREVGANPKNISYLPSNYVSLAELAKNDPELDTLVECYDMVFMTDISFNDWTYMAKLKKRLGDKFYWFDHHKPIIEESIKNKFDDIPGCRQTDRSAILCVYRFFYDVVDAEFNNREIPEVLWLLSEWDSWRWKADGYSEEEITRFNTGWTEMTKLDLDWYNINDIIELPDHYIGKANEIGRIICEKKEWDSEVNVKQYGETGWVVGDGRKGIMVVTSGPTGSQYFKCVRGQYDNGIIFKHTKDGKWTLSLYNVEEDHTFHCGTYLKEHYNGGGHEGAAGCTLDNDQFLEMIKNKRI